MAGSPLRWTVIECGSPYICGARFVADINLDARSMRLARVPLIDRALAGKGWATVGSATYCPACFDRIMADRHVDRDLQLRVVYAANRMPMLRQIEVG